jgi:hypothetical protein
MDHERSLDQAHPFIAWRVNSLPLSQDGAAAMPGKSYLASTRPPSFIR